MASYWQTTKLLERNSSFSYVVGEEHLDLWHLVSDKFLQRGGKGKRRMLREEASD